jgi:hypothetical protein
MAGEARGGMISAPPPSRYKVVERGRRLVVIDTRSGKPATRELREPVAATRPSLLAKVEQTTFDGRATLVTHRFYDLKAPRTLLLDSSAASLLQNARVAAVVATIAFVAIAFVFPWIVILPFVFLQPKARDNVRRAVTRWLDRFDQTSVNSGRVE